MESTAVLYFLRKGVKLHFYSLGTIFEENMRVSRGCLLYTSLNILVQYYAKTGALADFLAIQEQVDLDLMGLMEQAGCQFAFPSVSVYREK